MIYELFGESNKERLAESTLEKLKLNTPISVKAIKSYFIEQDCTFLGFIDDKNESFLSPKNNISIEKSHRLIYIQN